MNSNTAWGKAEILKDLHAPQWQIATWHIQIPNIPTAHVERNTAAASATWYRVSCSAELPLRLYTSRSVAGPRFSLRTPEQYLYLPIDT